MRNNLSNEEIKALTIVSTLFNTYGINRGWHTMASVSKVMASVTIWCDTYAQLEEVVNNCLFLGAPLDDIEKRYCINSDNYSVTYNGI